MYKTISFFKIFYQNAYIIILKADYYSIKQLCLIIQPTSYSYKVRLLQTFTVTNTSENKEHLRIPTLEKIQLNHTN